MGTTTPSSSWASCELRSEDRGYVTPCLIWTGYINARGYGVVTYRRDGRKTTMLAHRYCITVTEGPVAPHMEVDHLCEQRDCVERTHLEVVTHTENIRRSRSTWLTDEQIHEIRTSNDTSAALARRIGCSPWYVGQIRKGNYRT